MLVTLLGMITDVKAQQPEKAPQSMDVTLLGMVTETKLLHPSKTNGLIFVIPSGMITLVNPLHPWKAPKPMDVTLLGMVILFKPLQPLKAQSPIDVILLGMMVFEQPLTNLFEAVSIMALQFSRESYMTLLSSTTIVTNPLQPSKAERLMDVTEFGMDNEVNLLQLWYLQLALYQ